MTKAYVEAIKKAMIADNVTSICFGDGLLVDYEGFLNTKNRHPLNIMYHGLNTLERYPSIFIKSYTYAHDARGNPRKVRSFRIK
jgi:hypothetical protein